MRPSDGSWHLPRFPPPASSPSRYPRVHPYAGNPAPGLAVSYRWSSAGGRRRPHRCDFALGASMHTPGAFIALRRAHDVGPPVRRDRSALATQPRTRSGPALPGLHRDRIRAEALPERVVRPETEFRVRRRRTDGTSPGRGLSSPRCVPFASSPFRRAGTSSDRSALLGCHRPHSSDDRPPLDAGLLPTQDRPQGPLVPAVSPSSYSGPQSPRHYRASGRVRRAADGTDLGHRGSV